MAARLAPLSAAEIAFAVAQTRRWAAGRQLVFYEIDLHEAASTEAKEAALRGEWEALPRRRARVVAGEPAARLVLVGDVAVGPTDSEPPRLAERARTQPAFAAEEYAAAERLVVEYPPFRAACAARGIKPEHVRVDPWCAGWYSADDDPARRLGVPMLFVQERPEDNLYARPLEGIRMKLDLWATPPAVVAFLDAQRVPVPPRDPLMNFPSTDDHTSRPPLAPLRASQPQGASFTLGPGGLLNWQGWQLVVGFSAREGAVLHAVSLHGRPVAWRLSFAEMVVPYADTQHPHYLKNAFDAGEDGLGRNAHALDPERCDCAPGAAACFVDAALVTYSGEAEVLRNAVCIHEEEGGLLYKHLDWRSGASTARRQRKLVVMFLTTIANYTYGFAFKLGLDGSLEMEATLTGILSLGALAEGEMRRGRPWGVRLSPHGLYGPDHQHFFVARLDMAVDGAPNRVVEVDVVTDDDEGGGGGGRGDDGGGVGESGAGHGNGFRRRHAVFTTELQAVRRGAPQSSRHWLVQSCAPGALNRVGERTAWRLEPGAGSSIAPLARPEATYLRRAAFLQRNLWVTPYRPAERFPGGDFPNQNPERDGLPVWTAADRSIDGADLVVWHVFGLTHCVRAEDYPVMPAERVGFALKPCGFFDRAPCTDVPCDACAARPEQPPTSKL